MRAAMGDRHEARRLSGSPPRAAGDRLAEATYLAVGADDRGRLHAATIDARFHTVVGPRLRVERDGEARDI